MKQRTKQTLTYFVFLLLSFLSMGCKTALNPLNPLQQGEEIARVRLPTRISLEKEIGFSRQGLQPARHLFNQADRYIEGKTTPTFFTISKFKGMYEHNKYGSITYSLGVIPQEKKDVVELSLTVMDKTKQVPFDLMQFLYDEEDFTLEEVLEYFQKLWVQQRLKKRSKLSPAMIVSAIRRSGTEILSESTETGRITLFVHNPLFLREMKLQKAKIANDPLAAMKLLSSFRMKNSGSKITIDLLEEGSLVTVIYKIAPTIQGKQIDFIEPTQEVVAWFESIITASTAKNP